MTETKPCDWCGIQCKSRRTYHNHAGYKVMLCNKCYTTDITDKIIERLEANDLFARREYYFAKPRMFHFDIAVFKDDKPAHVAIEIDGGVYIKSGHSGGKNAEDAMVRGNLACMHGWQVLHYTPKMAMDASNVVEEVLRTIENRGGK